MNRGLLLPAFLLCILLPLSGQSRIDKYDAARKLQDQGEYFSAVEGYTELVREYPVYLEPLTGLAESYFLMGEYQDALTFAERALKLNRADSSLKVLTGRILVGLGSVERASAIFNEVLQAEPNNTEALLGIAEMNVATGDVGNALKTYNETLSLVPDEKRALLGLLLLSDELEQFEASETYVSAAVRYHGDSPQVQTAISRHYRRRGRLEDALYHARLAISIKPDYYPGLQAAARAHLVLGEYDNAITYLTEALHIRPGDPETFYTLGIAYSRTGRTDEAVRSFTSVFRKSRDDELARYALEELVKEQGAGDDVLRKSLALYHLERGREFEARFLLDKALVEYRFAVQLNPSSSEYRRAYAGIYKTLGYPAKYLTELEVIARSGQADETVTDELEIQRSLQEDNLSSRWGIDQFILDRNEYKLGVFAVATNSDVIHYAGDQVAGALLINLLKGRERVSVATAGVQPVAGYSEAFKTTRIRGDDFFVLISFDEKPRYFTVYMELYLAENGTQLKKIKTFRTGNDRVTDAVNKATEDLVDSLPLKAKLVLRDFDRGLVDAGRFDGLKGDEQFLILPPRSLSLKRDALGFEYPPEDVAGKLTITSLDELVAEGTIENSGFFDYINEGDTLILPVEDAAAQPSEDLPLNGLYQELLTIQ